MAELDLDHFEFLADVFEFQAELDLDSLNSWLTSLSFWLNPTLTFLSSWLTSLSSWLEKTGHEFSQELNDEMFSQSSALLTVGFPV